MNVTLKSAKTIVKNFSGDCAKNAKNLENKKNVFFSCPSQSPVWGPNKLFKKFNFEFLFGNCYLMEKEGKRTFKK